MLYLHYSLLTKDEFNRYLELKSIQEKLSTLEESTILTPTSSTSPSTNVPIINDPLDAAQSYHLALKQRELSRLKKSLAAVREENSRLEKGWVVGLETEKMAKQMVEALKADLVKVREERLLLQLKNSTLVLSLSSMVEL